MNRSIQAEGAFGGIKIFFLLKPSQMIPYVIVIATNLIAF